MSIHLFVPCQSHLIAHTISDNQQTESTIPILIYIYFFAPIDFCSGLYTFVMRSTLRIFVSHTAIAYSGSDIENAFTDGLGVRAPRRQWLGSHCGTQSTRYDLATRKQNTFHFSWHTFRFGRRDEATQQTAAECLIARARAKPSLL